MALLFRMPAHRSKPWRQWLIWIPAGKHGVRSVIRIGSTPRQEFLWPPGHAEPAKCLTFQPCAAPPARGCSCGYYGLTSNAFVAIALRRSDAPFAVVGRVQMWGRVVVCEQGWRAQFACPRELYVPSGANSNQADLKRKVGDLSSYGVPVSILSVKGIIERAQMGTEAEQVAN